MIKKLACINISSKQPERLMKFYQDIGVSIYINNGSYDGSYIGNPEKESGVCVWDERIWGPSTGGYITIVFLVDSLEETYRVIKEKRIEIEPPRKADWGGQELTLKDPDGNVIIFLT